MSASLLLGMIISVSTFGATPQFSFCKNTALFRNKMVSPRICLPSAAFGASVKRGRSTLSMGAATLLGSADGAAPELYEEYLPAEEAVEIGSAEEEIDPADVRNFPICEQTMEILAARGITKLFPVQAATFNEIYNGRDVLARARTGTGKTLGFALPILERLLLDKEAEPANGRRRGGQRPSCVILSPTRELAQQVGDPYIYCNLILSHRKRKINAQNRFSALYALLSAEDVLLAGGA